MSGKYYLTRHVIVNGGDPIRRANVWLGTRDESAPRPRVTDARLAGGRLYNSLVRYEDLAGAELVLPGIEDLRRGVESVPALLAEIGRPRLSRLGFELPPIAIVQPEHRLYELLAAEHGDAAHSRYNALIRRLVSFERAAACVS